MNAICTDYKNTTNWGRHWNKFVSIIWKILRKRIESQLEESKLPEFKRKSPNCAKITSMIFPFKA